MQTSAVILSAGSGTRFNQNFPSSLPKQFMKIAGKMVIEHTLEIFKNHELIDEILVVIPHSHKEFLIQIIEKIDFQKPIKLIEGGESRLESSYNALKEIPSDHFVLFHDAVRPLLSPSIISTSIDALKKHRACDVCLPATDTIVHSLDSKLISDIPPRKEFFLGQTPQGFHHSLIKEAYDKYFNDEEAPSFTDDCGLIKHYFPLEKIAIIQGNIFNHKITYENDLYIIDRLFQIRNSSPEITTNTLKNDIFKEKIVIIFGLSRGIGKALGKTLEEKGAKVYGGGSKIIDIRNPEEIALYLQQIHSKEGHIDWIIVTSGILKRKSLSSLSYQDVNDLINTNYLGSIQVAKEAYCYLKETKGQLLLFSSSSYSRGREDYAIYSSTKAAIVNLTQALATEWSKDNIIVNCAIPGRTRTDMRDENFKETDNHLNSITEILEPEEVANYCLKVLSQNKSIEPFLIKK